MDGKWLKNRQEMDKNLTKMYDKWMKLDEKPTKNTKGMGQKMDKELMKNT